MMNSVVVGVRSEDASCVHYWDFVGEGSEASKGKLYLDS